MDQKISAACLAATQLLETFCREQERELLRLATRIATLFAEGGQLMIAATGALQPVAQQLAGHFAYQLDFARPALPAVYLGGDTVLSGRMAAAGQLDHSLVRHYRALNSREHLLLLFNDGSSSTALKKLCAEVSDNDQSIALISGAADKDPLNTATVEVTLDLATASLPRQIELAQFAGHLLCELVEAELFGCRDDG